MSNSNSLSEGQVRKALAFGYSAPIVGLTLAFVTGAAINDLFGTLETWTWFAIQALIGASIITGAHFSAVAVAGSEANSHKAASNGASKLNLVLATIWFFFVGIQSFVTGAMAVSGFLEYSNSSNEPSLHAPSTHVWLDQLIPAQAFIVLTLAGVYFFVVLRSKGRKA